MRFSGLNYAFGLNNCRFLTFLRLQWFLTKCLHHFVIYKKKMFVKILFLNLIHFMVWEKVKTEDE